MRCVHCGLPVYRTNQGDWIDETEGDGCVTDVHQPDMSQVDGYVFECDGCNFYGENTEKVCPSCEAEIPDNYATPFAYEGRDKPVDKVEQYTWEHALDTDGHAEIFGNGTTAMIVDDLEGGAIAYCHTASAMDIVSALRMWHDSAERATLFDRH